MPRTDRLEVGTRVSNLGADRFTMEYALASTQLGRIAAEGNGIIVWYDYRANAKANIPATLRERIDALERTR